MLYYQLFTSPFGTLRLDWHEDAAQPRITRVWLPGMHASLTASPTPEHATPGNTPAILTLSAQLQAFLSGETLTFSLEHVALETCPPFQARVLRAEHAIPRGQVSTYGRIAAHLGVPGGARAVGNALARNPFPLLVPCHRAIAADGRLGGFQGGLAMKRRLLEMEGVRFSDGGKVLAAQYYY